MSRPRSPHNEPTVATVRAYWEKTHDLYLTHVGTTFQAGRIAAGGSIRESNLWLARAAGLRPGMRALDAGCGVCGPSIDIARELPGIRIVGITVSPRQASTATALIREADLSDRLHVVNGDYHELPFADRTFDAVFFLESIGYASSLTRLLTSVYRVLRPGGGLYIKDVFRRDRVWSDQELDELAEFNQVYAFGSPTVTACGEAAREAGFAAVLTRDLSQFVSTSRAWHAMFEKTSGESLSAFGRLHHRRYSCLPVYFAELTARRPPE